MITRGLMPLALAVALGVMPALSGWFEGWAGNRAKSSNALAMLLGDSRRLFSNHFFVKADAYFHRGNYPSIFDDRQAYVTPHLAADSGLDAGGRPGDEHVFPGESRDWIERFGRHFYPSEHVHLGVDEPCAHCATHDHDHEGDHGHDHENKGGHGHDGTGDEAGLEEILPWLRLSVAMDPQRIQSYLVGAYWLGERMKRPELAEIFLREGLRENPDSYELFNELAKLALDWRGDIGRARHLWTVAARKWELTQSALATPDTMGLAEIMAHLATAAEQQGDLQQALEYLVNAEGISGGRGLYTTRQTRLRGQLEADAPPAADL